MDYREINKSLANSIGRCLFMRHKNKRWQRIVVWSVVSVVCIPFVFLLGFALTTTVAFECFFKSCRSVFKNIIKPRDQVAIFARKLRKEGKKSKAKNVVKDWLEIYERRKI